MEIRDSLSNEELTMVDVVLTPEEASELRDGLDALIEVADIDRHERVASADFSSELTLRLRFDR